MFWSILYVTRPVIAVMTSVHDKRVWPRASCEGGGRSIRGNRAAAIQVQKKKKKKKKTQGKKEQKTLSFSEAVDEEVERSRN